MAATVPVVVAPALGSHHGRLMLVYALLALAILIAMLGTGNTPALSVFERTANSVLYSGAAKRTARPRPWRARSGRSRRKPHLYGKPTRQNGLFSAVATDRRLTVEAVPNGGSARVLPDLLHHTA